MPPSVGNDGVVGGQLTSEPSILAAASGPPADAIQHGPADHAERIAAPDQPGRKLLTEAAERMRLSARGYHRVLRVARTLADLEDSTGVRRHHVAEALSYRRVSPSR